MDSDTGLGQLLRQLRADRGEPLRIVAAAARMDSTLLSRIERGERLPTPAQLEALALHLGADPTELETLATASRLLRRHGSDSVIRAAEVIEARTVPQRDWTLQRSSSREADAMDGPRMFDVQLHSLSAPAPRHRSARAERLEGIEAAAEGARYAIAELADASADSDSVVALRARELLRQLRAEAEGRDGR